jgi:hypothetical protein
VYFRGSICLLKKSAQENKEVDRLFHGVLREEMKIGQRRQD